MENLIYTVKIVRDGTIVHCMMMSLGVPYEITYSKHNANFVTEGVPYVFHFCAIFQ